MYTRALQGKEEALGPKHKSTLDSVHYLGNLYADQGKLAEAEAKFGIKIHNFADLNLKNDIEGAASLSDACDLVVSAPTAAAALAGAIGKPVWFLVAGRVWPQLGTEEYPWYASSRVFMPNKFGDWSEVMQNVANALTAFAAAEQASQA